MFEGIFQPTHLAIILVIVMIIFGPGKLAGMGKTLGQSVRELREGAAGIDTAQSSTGASVVAGAPAPLAVAEVPAQTVAHGTPVATTAVATPGVDVEPRVSAGRQTI